MLNIGLVLSGGMAKGAYQIGALKAINEVFKPSDISYISSASVGALNTYIYLTNALEKGAEMWSGIESGNSRTWITAMLRSSFLQNSIKTLISDVEINNVFYIPLLNLRKRKLSYVNVGDIPQDEIEQYLRASVAMPIYNTAVHINGEHYYDGAIIDNIPIRPILKHSIDYIICIYFDEFNYTFESHYLDNKIIKINFVDNKFVSNSISFRKDSINYMLDEGYAMTKRILDYIFIGGKDDIESIYSQISAVNAMNTSKSIRISGDVIVNNMNKLTKRLMKRPDIR